MRDKIVGFVALICVFLIGSGATYVFLENPFAKGDNDNKVVDKSNETKNVDNSSNETYSGPATVIVNNVGISESVQKIYDAVVLIENFKNGKLAGTGSGFVYKKDSKYGYIMTNQHVVEGANKVTVLFTNEKKVDATILGGDEYLDIAVIKVPIDSIISVASIGSTEKLKLGESVFAVGSPVGEEYFNTITSGIISGMNRKVTVSVKSTADWIQEVLQVDAAINPGNSGGPLVNFNGEVIGVNSLKLVDSSIESMGFAIKIEDAMKHVKDLEAGKKIERPLLGINHINATDTYSLARNGITLDKEIEYGIVVISVVDGSGASKSDLKKGDVIIKIDNNKVTNSANLKYLLYKYNVGDKITITYMRSGKELTTEVTLTANNE